MPSTDQQSRVGKGALCSLLPTFARALAIVAIGAAVGLIANAFHPMGLPVILGEVEGPGIPRWVWKAVRRIDPTPARRLVHERAVLLLDVRDRKDYDKTHIPGAINLPYREFSTAYPALQDRLPRSATLLIYCYGSHCGLSMRVAKRLLRLGYRDLIVMRGGIAGWEALHYETTAPAGPGGRR